MKVLELYDYIPSGGSFKELWAFIPVGSRLTRYATTKLFEFAKGQGWYGCWCYDKPVETGGIVSHIGELFAASVLEKLYKMEENAMQKLSHDQRNQLIICNTKYYELQKEIEHRPYIMS